MGLHWRDTLNFIRHLTPKRIINIILLYSSYLLSKYTGKAIQWGQPMTISMEPTTACNLRCPECPSGLRSFSRETGNLKADFFRSTINQLSDKLIYLIFYFQGEPYINPSFLDMVKHANEKGLYTITSTNGHFLSMDNARRTIASGLDRIIISIDGTTQEVYENYRKEGKLDVVLQGTRNLVKCRKEAGASTPHIIFQMVVTKPNQHQIPEVHKLAKEIGVDEVKLKTAQVYDYKFGNPLIPTLDAYSRYRQNEDGTYEIKNKLLNHCWKLWHACVMTWDGMIVPCCFDKDASHRMGDLKQHNFQTIWEGDAYTSFRKSILKGRDQIDICRNCTEGCKVWA